MDMDQYNANLYLNLLKQCLVNNIYGEFEYWPAIKNKGFIRKFLIKTLGKFGLILMRHQPFDKALRKLGRDWPPFAHTMVGIKRLENIQYCLETIIRENIPGDLIETGVWRGGCVIFMNAILRAYCITNRKIWVADSFFGMPTPDFEKYPHDKGNDLSMNLELSVSLQQVKANFRKYELLDDNVRFIKGWFSDSLPFAPIKQLALLRLDADLYESTMTSLTNLYPKLVLGGFVIVDDYGVFDACKQAIHDYRHQNNITSELIDIDGYGKYWRKV